MEQDVFPLRGFMKIMEVPWLIQIQFYMNRWRRLHIVIGQSIVSEGLLIVEKTGVTVGKNFNLMLPHLCYLTGIGLVELMKSGYKITNQTE